MSTGKTIALTRWTFVGKVMSLLYNMLSRLVITFLPRSKRLNFMATVTICSDFGAQENKVCHCFHCFPIYFPWSDGTGCHDLSFLNVEGLFLFVCFSFFLFFIFFIYECWVLSQHFWQGQRGAKPCLSRRSRGHIFSIFGARETLYMCNVKKESKRRGCHLIIGDANALHRPLRWNPSWKKFTCACWGGFLGQVRCEKGSQIIGQR